jgi:hypothetical protein
MALNDLSGDCRYADAVLRVLSSAEAALLLKTGKTSGYFAKART